jgi:hypothetical protein
MSSCRTLMCNDSPAILFAQLTSFAAKEREPGKAPELFVVKLSQRLGVDDTKQAVLLQVRHACRHACAHNSNHMNMCEPAHANVY